MLGSAVNTGSVAPSVQVEWSTKLTQVNPLYASAGLGYLIQEKYQTDTLQKKYHQFPLFMSLGYATRLTQNWKASVASGPALRQIFERGNTAEQHHTYTYGDIVANLNLDYEWVDRFTGAGQSVGLRASRLFGVANANVSPAIDSLLLGLSFDL